VHHAKKKTTQNRNNMGQTEFFPHGTESVEIRFKCNDCETEVISDPIRVPSPNFEAEKASDSYNDNDGSVVCPNCGKEFNIWVNAGYADGYIEIDDISDEDIIEVIENQNELDEYYEEQIDALLSTSNFITLFKNEISNLKSMNNTNLGNQDLQKTLQRHLYSGAITCLEDYLATTLINEVLNNEENFKNFVRTFHGIRDRKFGLNELYEKLEQIENIVKKELVDVIYHDLPKVKGMYEDTLKVTFPDISELMKIIRHRHDMVHRNGKDKDGNEIVITKVTVDSAISSVESFVNELEKEIRKKSTNAQQQV